MVLGLLSSMYTTREFTKLVTTDNPTLLRAALCLAGRSKLKPHPNMPYDGTLKMCSVVGVGTHHPRTEYKMVH